ncbi:hypothetical protein DPMN_133238 [Dreissena polymorpha]|uniref:Uncharacterized protein n=1 Tax=Dreissena polymorpha TaxID=45954 RepID=A0A9D4FY28_DREPO|nr:hypothetical protein DPMN_133238 [Dreissena polymorpha]
MCYNLDVVGSGGSALLDSRYYKDLAILCFVFVSLCLNAVTVVAFRAGDGREFHNRMVEGKNENPYS